MAVTVKKVEKWAQKKKVNKLIKALSDDNTEVRIAVIKALGTTKDENAMNILISLLKDPDVSIRINAVEALGSIGNSRSIEFVRQLWNNDNNEMVQAKAKWAINEIKQNMTEEKF